jgi:hypothetical protein
MIRIVTHTDGSSPWISQCIESVEAACIPDMYHEVCAMRGGFIHARWEAMQSAEFVGFVDHDDIVMPGAISACMEALQATGAGVAFTDQIGINEFGDPVANYNRARFAMDVALDPQSLHHFALIRRDALGPEVLTETLRAGIGIDWLGRANAAMRMGAVHVPMVGYLWRQHERQESVATAAQYSAAMPQLRETIFGWMQCNFPIHDFQGA